MKKAVVASLLMAAIIAPSATKSASGQTDTSAASGAQSGAVQMPAAEYASYNNAETQTTPQTKAPAIEAYLSAYPQSAVKADMLQQLMLAYSAFDPTRTISAADRLLQVDPGNPRALTFEVYFRKAAADAVADPAGKQAALDAAASFAQKGLAATKPKDMTEADFNNVMTSAKPIFYSAIGTAALNKKDTATAITNFKSELGSVPVDQTTKPGPILQDTYFLGLAYLQSTPPDLLNCAFYVARFVAYAPEPYKSQMLPTAQYCYKRFHGNADGYDQLTAAAQANLNPPATLVVKPAPSPADIVAQTIASTPDLATLAIGDKEYILANGKPEDAEKVWDTIKGKSVELPDVIVVAVTDTTIQVSVSDDAVQSKTADFTFNLKAPLKTPPAVGDKVTLTGTYASYTPNPLMITMSDGEQVLPRKTPAKRPVHHSTHN